MPPDTPRRARHRTASRLARRIAYYAMRPDEIGARLAQLDREWPVERALAANAGTATLAGLALALTADRRWMLVPAAAGAFLVQHALQGWCPPLPLLRLMGVRSAEEIAIERYALKALRGDFRDVPLGLEVPPARGRTRLPEPGSPAARALGARAAAAMRAARP